MLDERKPYVIDITDKSGKLNLRDRGRGTPAIAIKCKTDKQERSDGKKHLCLFYYDIGCERGHILPGKVVKDLRNGIIFHARELNWDIKLTELTIEQFDERVRPRLQPEVSEMLNDLDDVYIWYRQMVGIN